MFPQLDAIEKRLSSIEVILSQLNAAISTNTFNEKEDIIGIDEVAKMLYLSKHTIYTKTHKNIIPHIKKGKKLLFSRKKIEAFIASGEINTISEEYRKAEGLIRKKILSKQLAY